ncbi:DUF309 domain-containing protein [uncultured Roseobacter sp.]|uniref:DUF309 domain-containing protein n=1 Tax=uncultured Roseobacter sp. TaxID=114847 RepID=UPI002624BC69|nr:DUF309 domain-containing protein [uncultured Roseobacter sp.]
MSLWPELRPHWRPPHAYIPGKTARHPEDWFDEIKASVAGVPPSRLHHTVAFQTGLAYFVEGFFWECHEVLEAVWMRTAERSVERELVVALIQLANARLKLEMSRPRAARRLCDIVDTHLRRCEGHRRVLGVGIGDLTKELTETRASL